MPGMDQLQKFNHPDNEQVTTERVESDDTDFSDDAAEITDSVAAEGETTKTETDSSMMGYQSGAASIGEGYTQPAGTHVTDADWNTTTEDDGMAPMRANEPDRSLGNS